MVGGASVRFLVVVLGVVLMLAAPVSGVTSLAQTTSPPNLIGESLFSFETTLAGTCDNRSFTFGAHGPASGPYFGTFQEQGSITLVSHLTGSSPIASLSAQFDILAQDGTQIVGTKEWVSGVSSGSAFCRAGGPAELRVNAYDLQYEATITTPDGQTCTTTGGATLVLEASTEYIGGRFEEDFISGTTPSCSGGGAEPPGEHPPLPQVVCDRADVRSPAVRQAAECELYPPGGPPSEMGW